MLQRFCIIMLKLLGWSIEGEYPHKHKKALLVCAPHTSNWDFPIGILIRGAAKSKCTFIAKNSLFKPPFGFIFRWLNGIPVDRSKRNNFVDQIIEQYNNRENLHIIITPEGMRKKAKRFKSGFYHIVEGANIPLIPAIFDWDKKEMIFESAFEITGDRKADIKRLLELFIEKGVAYSPQDGISLEMEY